VLALWSLVQVAREGKTGGRGRTRAWHPPAVADVQEELEALAALVPEDAWLTVPDIVERLDSDVPRVRRLLDDHLLVGVRRGRPKVFQVPAALVEPEPLVSLPGTLTVLFDAGFSDAEALRWLFTHDDVLDASPVEALRAGRIAPVRRRAQVLGY
jgi:Rv2175c C-terminal domain of unknown function